MAQGIGLGGHGAVRIVGSVGAGPIGADDLGLFAGAIVGVRSGVTEGIAGGDEIAVRVVAVPGGVAERIGDRGDIAKEGSARVAGGVVRGRCAGNIAPRRNRAQQPADLVVAVGRRIAGRIGGAAAIAGGIVAGVRGIPIGVGQGGEIARMRGIAIGRGRDLVLAAAGEGRAHREQIAAGVVAVGGGDAQRIGAGQQIVLAVVGVVGVSAQRVGLTADVAAAIVGRRPLVAIRIDGERLAGAGGIVLEGPGGCRRRSRRHGCSW